MMSKTEQYVMSGYRASLWLYPGDLRDAYGADMVAIFEQQLRAESTRNGTRGTLRIALRAIGELFTVAIPRRLASEGLITASLSLVINSGVLATLVWFMMRSSSYYRPGHH